MAFSPMAMNSPRSVGIVLGAGVRRDGQPSAALLRRATQGVLLYTSGAIDHLILSGGEIDGRPAEATVMAGVVQALGVPPAALTREPCARNTRQNARLGLAAARVLAGPRVDRLLVVSDGYHLPRAVMLFRRLAGSGGPVIVGVPVSRSAGRDRTRWLAILREAPAFLRDALYPYA